MNEQRQSSETHLELSEMPATDLDFLTIFGLAGAFLGLAGAFLGLAGVCLGLATATFGLPWPSLAVICTLFPGFPETTGNVLAQRHSE